MARNEERTQERMNRSIHLIRSLIGDYRGRIASIAGDGVMGDSGCAPFRAYHPEAVPAAHGAGR